MALSNSQFKCSVSNSTRHEKLPIHARDISPGLSLRLHLGKQCFQQAIMLTVPCHMLPPEQNKALADHG